MARERLEEIPARNCNRFCGLFFVAIAFLLMAMLSWRKWPDLLIDFGAQLYIPWQLSLGKVLYRDVMYFAGGPLSQYFNALLFKIFGATFATLIFSNLIIAALLLILVYRFFLKISDDFTATIICLTIVLVFAFSQYLQVGNYNYISPYAHEAVHGTVLSILALTFFSSWFRRRNLVSIFAAGFCFGLVFLTKPDIFTALAAATLVAFALGYFQTHSAKWILQSIGCFFLAAIIPIAMAFLLFRSVENNVAAARSVVWAWVPLLTTSAAKNEFYQSGMGFDDFIPNVILSASQFFGYVFVIALSAWASRKLATGKSRQPIFATVIFLGLVIATFFHKWFESARALLFFAPTICAVLFWSWRKSAAERNALTPAILWSIFAWALLAKMGVHCRIWHYGFYLAMPATAAALYFVLWFLPQQFQRWNVPRTIFRIAIVALLAVGIGFFVTRSTRIYATKTLPVGKGADRIFSGQPPMDPTGAAMSAALGWINANCSSNATLAVLPEGVMLNYLSRRENPTRYNFLLPVWQNQFGEKVILAAYKKNPPDFVALIQRDTSEFGFDYFGQTEAYGLKTMNWIRENYSAVQLIGNEPLVNGAFGIKVFKRNSAEHSHILSQ